MYEYNQYILNHKNSVIFEIIEIISLFFLTIYYLIKNHYVLSIVYLVPFIEHIRQVKYEYRQEGGSLIDYLTLCYFICVSIYSIKTSARLSFVAAICGCLIHIITIIKKTSFTELVSSDDIKNYIY